MSENEQRLQRHVRAMGGGEPPVAGPAGRRPIVDALRRSGRGRSSDQPRRRHRARSSAVLGARGPPTRWLEQLAVSAEGHKPFLVRLANGKPFLIEGGYRREVRSGLLVADARARCSARAHTVSDRRGETLDRRRAGRGARGPQGPPFVVVGGKRLPLRGLPLPYPVSRDQMQLFPPGRNLNVAEANVSRAKFQRAMYGRYQVDRVRSAVASEGTPGRREGSGSRAESRRARRSISRSR